MSKPDAVVILVRHGRTALNAAGLLRGRLDPPLDEVGEAEAHALGSALRGCGLATVVTSPLIRARQTAAAIARVCDSRVEVEVALADRDYGPWAGSAVEHVIDQFGSIDAAPGVEPWEHFVRRAVSAVCSAAEKTQPDPVVVVAHDAINRAVLGYLVPSLEGSSPISQPTGCWNRLERWTGSWDAPVIGFRPEMPGRIQ